MKRYIIPVTLAILWAAACVSPIVGFATFSGTGSVRTDGNALVAFGDIIGEAGVFAKGSNLPVTLPFVVDEGYVYLYHSALGINELQPLAHALPVWAHELIPPVHQSALEEALGVQIYFEDQIIHP